MDALRTLVLLVKAAAVTGEGGDMVDIRTVCPSIKVELRYASARNGVGRAVYPRGSRCLLRRAVADRLCRVQQRLEQQGVGLKVWDAYRPLSAQKALWEVCPDARFVAPPTRGSRHNRGAAVDVTLVNRRGRELAMPCDFDTFGRRAATAYPGGDSLARRHRDLLHAAMQAEGFLPDSSEWWHFSDPDWKRYPLANFSLKRSARP